MFDRIVEQSDAEARRREAVSLAWTSALCAAVIGFALGSAAWWVAPAAGDSLPEVPIAFLPDEPEGGGTPELPAAPEPRPRASTPAPEPDPEAVPTATPQVAITPEPTGPGGTSDPGTGGGRGGGTTPNTGTPEGLPCADDCSTGVQIRNHTKLEAKRRVQPRYPEAAKALGLGEQRCTAIVRVDADGVPFDVVVEDCPAVFHPQTRESLLGWRFWPARDGHTRIPAQTRISVVYRLQD